MQILKYFVLAYQSVILIQLTLGKVVPVTRNDRVKESVFQLENTSLSCKTDVEDIYSFTIPCESPVGPIDLMLIQHDGIRKMPVTSTALHNSLNHLKVVQRKDHFRQHPCPALTGKQIPCSQSFIMTPEQQAFSGKTSYDRGHLTPFNPMRFSESAADVTFYCVNIAPQEPYTNEVPWVTVEEATLNKFNSTPGYVMTGVCDRDSPDGTTQSGWSVPDCFWKLVCYRDALNTTRVVGFIGNNTLLASGDKEAQAERKADTLMARSQFVILGRMNRPDFVKAAWIGAQKYLLYNRNEEEAPNPNECINTQVAPEAVLDEWTATMRTHAN